MKDHDGYRKVQALLDLERGLSDWEIGFAESLAEQLEDGRTLTEKQREKLDEVTERVDERGLGDEDEEC